MKNLLRLTAIASVVLISLSTSASAKVPEGWLTGGANFEKAMQLHREQNVPLVVYFYVDWCPYCKTQLADLQSRSAQLAKQGLSVAAISYDPDPVLADFQKYGFIARVEKPYRMQELGKTLRSVLTDL